MSARQTAAAPMSKIDRVLLSREAANRLVADIAARLDTTADSMEQLPELIEQAKVGAAHEVLGYRSWVEFIADKFGERLTRLARLDRGPIVEMLSAAGMSTRAIEAASGVSKSTADRHLSHGGTRDAHSDRDLGATGEGPGGVLAAHQMPIPKVAGVDGKSYTRPTRTEPRKPRRRPLPEAYRSAADELQKAVARLERLHTDDRFDSNRQSLPAGYGMGGYDNFPDLAHRITAVARHLNGTDRKLGGPA